MRHKKSFTAVLNVHLESPVPTVSIKCFKWVCLVKEISDHIDALHGVTIFSNSCVQENIVKTKSDTAIIH